MKLQTISIHDVEKYRSRPGVELIDLREEEAYKKYHLPGAINIPYEKLDEYKKRMSKKYAYILYCERGGSSMLAAKELNRDGFQVYSVIGGIRALEEKLN